MSENRCICCGEIIPEGRQVCPTCEANADKIRQYKFTIYGNPVTKKNSMQIVRNPHTGRYFIAPSSQYKKYCRECIKQLNTWVGRPTEPIDYPVRLTYLFYKQKRILCDDLNHSEAIDDILVQAGIIRDDNRDNVESHDGTRVYYDKENPRVEITITEMKGWEQWKKGK